MSLEELFLKYKDISLTIIKVIDEDDLYRLDELLLEREILIKEISKRNENKENLRKLYEEYDLITIDKEMKEKIESSLDEVKQELIKIKKRKEANKGYSNLNVKSVFLSKKI